MKYYNFSRLIKKYSSEFEMKIVEPGNYGDDGEYVDGESNTYSAHGAIVNFKESKLYRSDGTLTSKDKHLFMTERIKNALLGATVEYDGNRYRIESELENAKFTGVYSYVLRWVSAFD